VTGLELVAGPQRELEADQRSDLVTQLGSTRDGGS
jgi:hypothetical protein